jgi:hypothetical protein
VAVWLTAVTRKVATGSVPSLLTLSAVVLTVQAAVVLATGELWLFLSQVPLANLCMCVVFARTARGPNPLVARLAAEVVALRQPAVAGGSGSVRLACIPGRERTFFRSRLDRGVGVQAPTARRSAITTGLLGMSAQAISK